MAPDGNWARPFLAAPVDTTPGTHFVYNTGASYMLSAIVQSLTGQTILDYLTPRIFEPLGIEGATWVTCPRGINTGGFGLSVKTTDIARFGQLYLQQGVWQGAQLIPAAWVVAATSRQVDNGSDAQSDWAQGYGYQFWRCRHNAYRGDGAFGQYCIVMPDQDAVLAITSGVEDMQAVLDLVWGKLLPAMGAAALPEDGAAQAALTEKLAGLVLRPLGGEDLCAPEVAARVSGKTFTFDLDAQRVDDDRHMPSPEAQLLRSVGVELQPDGGKLTLTDGRGPHTIAFGSGAWVTGVTEISSDMANVAEISNDSPPRVAASGTWVDATTLAVKVCLYETPFCPTLTCAFDGDQVRYQFVANVAFGPRERPELVGKVV
jgi:hypothetical protein